MVEKLSKRVARGVARVGLDFLGVRDAGRIVYSRGRDGILRNETAGAAAFLHLTMPALAKAFSYANDEANIQTRSGMLKAQAAIIGGGIIDIGKIALGAPAGPLTLPLLLFITGVENALLSTVSGIGAEVNGNGRRGIFSGMLPK